MIRKTSKRRGTSVIAALVVLCAVLGALFRKKGWIKDGDLKLD